MSKPLPSPASPGNTPVSGHAASPVAAPSGEYAIEARKVTKDYGSEQVRVRALRSVDLRVPAGQFLAVMGPSGSGKSTLLSLFAGLDTPTSGEVLIGDVNLAALSDTAATKLRRAHIGMVFQSFNLLDMYTAKENIALPLRLAGTAVDEDYLLYLASRLNILPVLGRRPPQMSAGQRQRVAIARALLPRPRVLLADEPTGALDTYAGIEVLELLRAAGRELGQTVVMVTHDTTCATYAERVVLLADGRISGEIVSPTEESVMLGFETLRPGRI